jgi:hypothetical protein
LGEATNIPAYATQIIVTFFGLSSNATGEFYVTVGNATYTTSQRTSIYTDHTNGTNSELNADGRTVVSEASVGNAESIYGTVTFTKLNGSDIWMASGTSYNVSTLTAGWISGSLTASSAITNVKVTCSAGVFDGASEASVYWV